MSTMTMIPIRVNDNNIYQVSEDISLVDLERAEPLFFRTPHGKRETYTMHRGAIIVRNTVQFTGAPPRRRTAVYLYLQHNPNKDESSEFLFCVSTGSDLSTVAQAKRLIDYILEVGEYRYGTYPPWNWRRSKPCTST